MAAGPQVAAQDAGFTAPADFSALFEARLPLVAGIFATGAAPGTAPSQRPMLPPGLQDFFGFKMPDCAPEGPRQALGPGFIISEDGYVVTNDHVISGAQKSEVTLGDDRRLEATLVGTDPATDIALLKVKNAGDLPAVAWGSLRDLRIGERVLAIGNPFGLEGSVTAGIVSSRLRAINSRPYDDFIQTDGSINSGNSGGLLFNSAGNVIGVNTAIFSPTGGNVGIGFAVPAHVAQRVVENLKDEGMVERGWLGVTVAPLSAELRAELELPETLQGPGITGVDDGSAAAQAGLAQGYVIVRVGDRDATDMDAVRHALERAEAEERRVLMRVYSGGTYRFVAVPLDEDA